MRFSSTVAFPLAANLLPPLASAIRISPAPNGALLLRDSYDYIVVGAGIGGLVVANRLTEDPSVSVLVIEAGDLDDRGEDVSIPGSVGFEDPRRYEVKLTMTEQEFLDNKTRTVSQGKAVGGGTIVNGLVWTRGSTANFDAWERLGNPGWGWSGLLPYFRKSETYSTRDHDISACKIPVPVHPVNGKHGDQGPVEVGYPNYYYNQSDNFLDGVQQLGIPVNEDPNSGNATGATVVPSSMTQKNQSRSDARTAYLDPALGRDNLHLVTNHTVTHILHNSSGNAIASRDTPIVNVTGVEFASNVTGTMMNVTCDKEVILAAGAILSPVLLQISGIGPAQHLKDLGVNVAVDLPGVGSNFQDHPTLQPVYKYTAPDVFSVQDIVGATRDAVREEYLANRTGPWTTPMVNAVAFPALSWVTDNFRELLDEAVNTTSNLPSSYDSTLRAGYAAQKNETLCFLSRTDTPTYELMSTSWGQLAVSAMQPFSRGTVLARSSSIFDNTQPIVDPRYCSNSIDCKLLLLGIKFNDHLIATSPMAALMPVPPPGFGTADARNETSLDETMRAMITTGFHFSGTTSMLPQNLGGVVDPSLRVYGTANLRVVDAGVIPLLPGAHTQATVYAIAEKAADIIKAGSSDAFPGAKS
ncbi:putative GMC oxidoreductase [Hypoxylon trugodes]|uniref:putative GMC oxidoreductase n=1 Tax=Hypoxylon trugodes TaxID=326681 RepID=UPI00219BB251|nr:putative GMC oxidoreductase [Hypoxylon trugodes]KAI1386138.1 putative GMC oxidoreductase [Hypoxylon trugodes]